MPDEAARSGDPPLDHLRRLENLDDLLPTLAGVLDFVALNCAALPEQLLESELFDTNAARSRARSRPSPDTLNRPPATCCSSTRWPR
jgi:hypothetical protein